MNGSVTVRASTTEGRGNDRHSARLGLEWRAGRWAGGFTAAFENTRLQGAIAHRSGIGTFDLPERWIGWKRQMRRSAVSARIGTSPSVRFGEGLVLGAATFDGLHLTLDAGAKTTVTTLLGRTDTIDPADFYDEPFTLFPSEDEDLGRKGDLFGVRTEVRPRRATVVGVNLLGARTDGVPTARLASVDVAASRGVVDLAMEAARDDDGGTGLYLRTDITPGDAFGIGIEHRRYESFVSPLGSAPRYGGLSASDDHDEDGWLLRFDFAPARRFSGSVSFDYSAGGPKSAGPTVRRDHRVALQWTLTRTAALSYGFELEDLHGGYDGTQHSLLFTRSFARGGRFSARYGLDRTTPGHASTLRLGYRVPLMDRRVTLLFDDTIRHEDGSATNALSAGASFRVKTSSFVTVRGTLEDGAPESADVTWYRRF